MTLNLKPIFVGLSLLTTLIACSTTPPTTSQGGGPTTFVDSTTQACHPYAGGPVTVDTKGTFADGILVRDAYSGTTATTANGQVTLTPAPQSGGLLLLERAKQQPSAFSWDNATVYFVITDRFYNGNHGNDHAYGRHPDGMKEVGTFHGGDLQGLTQKLDYIEQLGANVLWISAPYEQIHGWIGGGQRGDFPHYAYHGYYPLDYTRVDASMGTEQDMARLVDEAHKRGIRVVMDIVMNHAGYATMADMQQFKFGKFQQYNKPLAQILGVKNYTDWTPGPGENWHAFNNYIDYGDYAWLDWWGKNWIRTDIAGYNKPGRSDLTMSLSYLPDFRTESTEPAGLPVFYKNKPDTLAKEIPGYTVRQYLVTWLSDWVRKYGIDGFRADTAKHVEKPAWKALKQSASKAFAEWKAANPDKVLDDSPFWMTGEVWGHGLTRDDYYDNGFDSLINFTYQTEVAPKVTDCLPQAEDSFARYANAINSRGDFNVLSYLSSHDTSLFFRKTAKGDLAKQKNIAAPFLLLPGAVQIFYGDESARHRGPSGSDPNQGTRSDMNWQQLNDQAHQALLAHWQKIANFRKHHRAIGAGEHTKISDHPYAFSRVKDDDAVIVVYGNQ